MLQSKANWTFKEIDHARAEEWAQAYGLDPWIAEMLDLRGLTNQEIDLFLHGGAEQLHNPYLLHGMKQAVERILLAISKQEKIRIYGDYDADGVSATSLMIHLLGELGADFDYYIPHRATEGYGLNQGAMDHANKNGISLIITVDTGISARKMVEYAGELGIDVVITDHHEPPEHLPQAVAIINPKQQHCPYPFKHLAGVGIAFKLAHALLGRWPEELAEIAAIGTIADLMPLTGENRIIVKLGLERMQHSEFIGIRALLGIAGVRSGEVTSSDVAFALSPRINAGGRLTSAEDAVKLLTTTSEQEAEHLAHALDQLNKERQKIVEEMLKQARQWVEAERQENFMDDVIVLAEEGWNVGVIGIVAAKLLDIYYRPVIILSIDRETGIAKGSARSIAGFDLYQALTQCADIFDHFGGHQRAAGMTLQKEKIPELKKRLNEIAGQKLSEYDYVPVIHADRLCELNEATMERIESLQQLAPFGMGNAIPTFVFNGLRLAEKRTMGRDGQHLKLLVSQGENEAASSIEALGFGLGSLFEAISPTAAIDLLGELAISEWNGVRKAQLIIRDLRVREIQVFDWRGTKMVFPKWAAVSSCNNERSASRDCSEEQLLAVMLNDAEEIKQFPELQQIDCTMWCIDADGSTMPLNEAAHHGSLANAHDVLFYSLPHDIQKVITALQRSKSARRCYALFLETDEDESIPLPAREVFKMVYAEMQYQSTNPNSIARLSKRTGLSPALCRFIIDVFEELSFIQKEGDGYRVVDAPGKRELAASVHYQSKVKRNEAEHAFIYSSSHELTDWFLSHLVQSQI